MIKNEYFKTVLKGLLSLITLFICLLTLGYFFQGINDQVIFFINISLVFIILLIGFPSQKNLKHKLIFAFLSVGIYWLVHLIIVLSSSNVNSLWTSTALLILIISFFINIKFKYLFRFLLFCLLVFTVYFFEPFKKNTPLSKMIISQSLDDKSKSELDLDKAITILELWNSSCVYCIEEFPKFQKFYEEYKDIYTVVSINIPIERDSLNEFNPNDFVKSKGFNFPVHQASNDLINDLDVDSFPKLIIIKNDIIIFKANMVVPKDNNIIINIIEEYQKLN